MKVLYSSCLMSEKKLGKLVQNSNEFSGFQVQKFHKLFTQGLVNNGIYVRALTILPVNKKIYKKKIILSRNENVEGIQYHYPLIINLSLLKKILNVFTSFVYSLLFFLRNPKCILISDCLNQSVSLGSILAAKICRIKSIGIITDLPDMLTPRKSPCLNNIIIKLYDNYIILTEATNDYIVHNITKKEKPYYVIEGMVDVNMKHQVIDQSQIYDKKVCLYSGLLTEKYGLKQMVEGFSMVKLKNIELHIYGDGDFKKQLIELCQIDKRIKYLGLKPNAEIVKEQQKCSLLINPRPSSEEFTKYSFPSKNMEYMVSGIPILTTLLPGMPKEYFDFVYVITQESAEGIKKILEELLLLPREELLKKGVAARNFVLRHKNNTVQVKKILDFYVN